VVPKKKRILSILRAYAVFGLLFALVMPSIWHALAVSTMFALIPTMFIIWDPVPGDASSTLAKTLPGLIFVAFSLAATCIVPARRDLWWLAIVLVALGAGLGHVAWYMLRRPRHNLGTRA
jgi:hypothetical protein